MGQFLNNILDRPAPIPTVAQDCNRVLYSAIETLQDEGAKAWKIKRLDVNETFAPAVQVFESLLADAPPKITEEYTKVRKDLDAARQRYEEAGFDADFKSYQKECAKLFEQFWDNCGVDNFLNTHPTYKGPVHHDPQFVARALIPQTQQESFEIIIPMPDGISNPRSSILTFFLNRALNAHWKAKSEKPDDVSKTDCPPNISLDFTNCEFGKDGRPITEPDLKIYSKNRITSQELAEVAAFLSAEIKQFAQGWKARQQPGKLPTAYKRIRIASLDDKDDEIDRFQSPPLLEFLRPLQALSIDLMKRGILPGDPQDDRKWPVKRKQNANGADFVTVTGKDAIQEILVQQMGVKDISYGGPGV